MLNPNETAIPIKKTTRELLKSRIKKNETYNSYLLKVSDFFEKSQTGVSNAS